MGESLDLLWQFIKRTEAQDTLLSLEINLSEELRKSEVAEEDLGLTNLTICEYLALGPDPVHARLAAERVLQSRNGSGMPLTRLTLVYEDADYNSDDPSHPVFEVDKWAQRGVEVRELFTW